MIPQKALYRVDYGDCRTEEPILGILAVERLLQVDPKP